MANENESDPTALIIASAAAALAALAAVRQSTTIYIPGTGAPALAPSGAGNLVFATPNGLAGLATLRALVAGDIPALPYDPAGQAVTEATIAQANAILIAANDATIKATAALSSSKDFTEMYQRWYFGQPGQIPTVEAWPLSWGYQSAPTGTLTGCYRGNIPAPAAGRTRNVRMRVRSGSVAVPGGTTVTAKLYASSTVSAGMSVVDTLNITGGANTVFDGISISITALTWVCIGVVATPGVVAGTWTLEVVDANYP